MRLDSGEDQSFCRGDELMKSLIVMGAAVLLSATIATAQQRGPVGTCAADIKAKCAGVERGEGRVSACVKEHLAEFSEPCQARLAKIATLGDACRADVTKNCAGKGRLRRVSCVKEALGNLSDPCKDALAKAVDRK
jgi:hypothetical protein